MAQRFLIADIGGTNARFAISVAEDTGFQCRETLQTSDHETIEAAIEKYLDAQDVDQIDGICIAAAGPIRDNSVKFTNNHWVIHCDSLRNRFATEQVKLLNDWESIAYALPGLGESDLLALGGNWKPVSFSNGTAGAIGPGSGLGVTAVCVNDGVASPIVSEGGHTGFAPENRYQLEILRLLQKKFERVSNERLLSGPGLENIYLAVCALEGADAESLNAAQIANQGVEGKDAMAAKTLALFFEILGQAAGDLALVIGATAGIFVGGGICQRYPEALEQSRFREGFENKGRHSQIMTTIPTWLVMHQDPGLLGAYVYAQTRMAIA